MHNFLKAIRENDSYKFVIREEDGFEYKNSKNLVNTLFRFADGKLIEAEIKDLNGMFYTKSLVRQILLDIINESAEG